MPASAHDVAAAIRRRLNGAGGVKLHKLLYFAQGHHLADCGEPLFDERIDAWTHGPVVVDLWQDEKYGNPPEEFHELDNGQLNTIGYVISRYGHNTARDLEMLTHAEGPWQEAYERADGDADRHTISVDAIREFFAEESERERAEDEVQLDPADVAQFLAEAAKREHQPATPDTRESLLARIRG